MQGRHNTHWWIGIGPDPVSAASTGPAFHPMPLPDRAPPLIDAFTAAVERGPDRIAIHDVDGPMRFGELGSFVASLAARLAAEPGSEPVGVLLPPCAAYAASVFACVQAGRICVPLDASAPDGRNLAIAQATGIKVLFAGEEVRANPSWAHATVIAVESLRRTPARNFTATLPALPLDAPAFIICTSGSTGRPKPVVHSQRTIFSRVSNTNNASRVTPDDRVLSLSALSTIAGFLTIVGLPLIGACADLVDIRSVGLSGLLNGLKKRPVTILRAAPSMLRMICALPEGPAALSKLRLVQTYGEPLTRADAVLLRGVLHPACEIRTSYGSTEASGTTSLVQADDERHPVYVSAGVLQPCTEAALVDEDGRSVGPGEVGELWVKSRYHALGDWAEGRITMERLDPDPHDPQARIYRTGDLARRGEDGVFVILGRKDRMLKINGQRIEPAEVEAVLRGHPQVSLAQIVADLDGKPAKMIAFVVPTTDAGPGLLAELRTRIREALPSYMMPARIVTVASIPTLPSGKADGLRLLRELLTPMIATSS